jgi:plasmid stabilization system protein ParE
MKRFPYIIFYEARGDTLIIVGIIHGRRDPVLWKRRLGLE